ncbi:MAG: hypothetical protein ACKVHR_16675 [Pirellulales bacterium]|jgi:hypothetical protein
MPTQFIFTNAFSAGRPNWVYANDKENWNFSNRAGCLNDNRGVFVAERPIGGVVVHPQSDVTLETS